MTARRTQLLRGVAARLAVAVLAIASAAVLLEDDGESFTVTAEFERAGLNVRAGDEVRVRGIPIGRITSIEVDRQDFSATYVLSLDPDVAIAGDTTARLVPKTLFGDKFVELQPAVEGGPVLADGTHLDRSRTQAPTELQSVLDRLEPTLEQLDPIALSATLASLATAFDDAAPDFRRLMDDVPALADTIVAAQADLASLLAATPGVAGTVTENADALVSAASQFAELADLVVESQPELASFLTGVTDLSTQAAALLAADGTSIDAILRQGTDVLGIVSQHPGAITALLDGAPRFVNGLAAATSTGAFRAPIANFVILNPGSLFDAAGGFGEANGGTGPGPDVVVDGLGVPEVPLDLTDPEALVSTSVGALNTLLGNLLLGGGA
jgi:phospholipid/cholesterol/gamma-HCH transport system substrate-binding protein